MKTLPLKEKLRLIDDDKESPSIRKQCDLLGINRGTLYYKPKPKIKTANLKILKRMDEIYTEFPEYGYRRQYEQLVLEEFQIGKERVRQYMKILGLEAQYPKPKTSKPNKEHSIFPYLLRNLPILSPNHVWAADITYIRLKSGFCYLFAIIDWYSRYIVSWKLSNSMDVFFCLDGLKDALKQGFRPIIFNTDQGSQFTSMAFTMMLLENHIQISHDSVGRWQDNVMIERFWRTLKVDNVYREDYATPCQARDGIGLFIDKYNRKRLHSSLGYKTPFEVFSSLN